MPHLLLDYSYAVDAIPEDALGSTTAHVLQALSVLSNKSGRGGEFLGWIDLPERSRNQVQEIQELTQEIRQESDVFIIAGIGGSYLGARAVIDACTPFLQRSQTEVLYVGHHLSGEYLASLMTYCEGKRVSVNVISKSGTTTETALAFRVLKQWMEHTYGRRVAAKRIIATTDRRMGSLQRLARQEGYRTFEIPEDVGGRFSVLTPVGLLPIAVAQVDIEALLDGASYMRQRAFQPDILTNPSLMYAVLRHALMNEGKIVEILSTFQPELQYLAEWWKQLFGESEGKEHKGIFPASVVNTTDLHSLGQYIQQGKRLLFETFLTADRPMLELLVPSSPDDGDGLNYLTGRSFSYVNQQALAATALAHKEGDVPNMTIRLPALSAESIGELLYFFQAAVALSGYALGINPFDQPGVEDYKRNMFALLNKPGYEDERKALLARIESRPKRSTT